MEWFQRIRTSWLLGRKWSSSNRRQRRAKIIATAVVASTFAALTLAASFSGGLQSAIRAKVGLFYGQAQIRNLDQTSVYETQPHFEGLELDSATWMQMAWKAGVATGPDGMEGLQWLGWEHVNPNWSELITKGSAPKEPYDVLLSEKLSARLGLDVGDEMPFYASREAGAAPTVRYLNVTGLYRTGLAEWDAQTAVGRLDGIRALQRWPDSAQGTWVHYGSTRLSSDDLEHVRSQLPFTLDVYRPSDDLPALYQWLDLFDANVAILAVVLLIVGAVNLGGTLLILALEQQRAWALLRALGWSPAQAPVALLGMLAPMLLRGALFGVSIAMLALWAQDTTGFVRLNPDTYYVDQVPVSWDFSRFLYLYALVFLSFTPSLTLPWIWIRKMKPASILKSA
jgi:lipoprotein-releasing system permease protein